MSARAYSGFVAVVGPDGYATGKHERVKFQLEEIVGLSFLAGWFGDLYFANLKDFRQVEVSDDTFHRLLDAGKRVESHVK